MFIGVSGDIGSFSEEVGLLYAEKIGIKLPRLKYLIDMEGVLNALTKGEISLGIFPVVNNNSGLVWPAFIAMGKYQFSIIDEFHLSVKQCLMAQTKLKLKQIDTVYSYTPAFNQCKNFLNEDLAHTKQVDWGDTAKSARDLAQGLFSDTTAVIGSAKAAVIYNLEILAEHIEDIKPNITMFVIVKQLSK